MASETTEDPSVVAPSLASRITRDDDMPQADGAAEPHNGSKLTEPEYDVEVKLADLQGDPNNPLFSVQKFEDLGL